MRLAAEAAPLEGDFGLSPLFLPLLPRPPSPPPLFLDLPAARSAVAASRSAAALLPSAAALFAYSDLGIVARGLPANARSAPAGSDTNPTPANAKKRAQPAVASSATTYVGNVTRADQVELGRRPPTASQSLPLNWTPAEELREDRVV